MVPFGDLFLSSDLSLAGDEITRVRIWSAGFRLISSMFGSSMFGLKGRSQFVNFAQVNLTCIPHEGEFLGQEFAKLPEVPWETDPSDPCWPALDVVAIAPEAISDSASGPR
jgi:hypothetical protein